MADLSRDVITLSSDSEDDEDLKRAIALSLQDQDIITEPAEASKNQKEETKEEERKDTAPPAPSGIMGFDRKQMEQERLARLATKRRREASGNDDQDNDHAEAPPSKKRARVSSLAASSRPPISSSSSTASAASSSTTSSTIPFPKGVVKRTWAYGYPRTNEDIKIEEVLQRDKLELAILSSFQWDEEWLLTKVNVAKTKLLLLAYAPDEAQVGQSPPPWPPLYPSHALCKAPVIWRRMY